MLAVGELVDGGQGYCGPGTGPPGVDEAESELGVAPVGEAPEVAFALLAGVPVGVFVCLVDFLIPVVLAHIGVYLAWSSAFARVLDGSLLVGLDFVGAFSRIDRFLVPVVPEGVFAVGVGVLPGLCAEGALL